MEKTIVEATQKYDDKIAKCRMLAAEIRKIYVENWAKTTGKNIGT